jgi:hypothetical protein
VREGLYDYVRTGVDLVPKYFPTAGPVRCEIDYGRETGDSWVTLRFDVQAGVDQALDWYDSYTEGLLDAVPWPQCDRIRVFFSLV